MAVTPLPPALPADRAFNLLEQMKRIEAMPYEDDHKSPSCSTVIHVGIFFDGTNNNKERDQVKVLEKTKDPNKCSHSNVVVLHDAFRDDPKNGYYKFYVPGVGTPCPEVNEFNETPSGKSQATGGDARINRAMLQLLNAMHRSMCDDRKLIQDNELTRLATSMPLHAGKVPDANLAGKRSYFWGSNPRKADGKVMELQKALEAQGPQRKLAQVNVYVFGFSRGAAQARAFCHFVHHTMLEKVGQDRTAADAIRRGTLAPADQEYRLAGVPTRIAFLGLFDTVASVGLADQSWWWRGLGGWANGTLAIVPSVRRTVHLCAAHEIRINFPLSSTRDGDSYPPNCIERVYPGAHSDVGGGYDPGSQGKAVGSRARLLSQVPLLDMYRQARLARVPLLSISQLRKTDEGGRTADDFSLASECAELFDAYRSHASGIDGSVEEQLHAHMQIYWRWRLQHLGEVDKLPSYARARRQDQIDMWESERDFTSDVFKALVAERLAVDPPLGQPKTPMTPAQRDFVKVRADLLCRRDAGVPKAVDRFFDEMVHDSHASFYLAGPVTEADRMEKIKQIARKYDEAKRNLEILVRQGRAPLTPDQIEKAATLSLSELEQRIHDFQKAHPGEFPEITDADRWALLGMEDLGTGVVVWGLTDKTRREPGGHVCYRRVFDKS